MFFSYAYFSYVWHRVNCSATTGPVVRPFVEHLWLIIAHSFCVFALPLLAAIWWSEYVRAFSDWLFSSGSQCSHVFSAESHYKISQKTLQWQLQSSCRPFNKDSGCENDCVVWVAGVFAIVGLFFTWWIANICRHGTYVHIYHLVFGCSLSGTFSCNFLKSIEKCILLSEKQLFVKKTWGVWSAGC